MRVYKVFSGFSIITHYKSRWETESLREDMTFGDQELIEHNGETLVFRREKKDYYVSTKNVSCILS